ncbi:MAG: uracil-DNA glycosylase [Candidatus Thermoplasmatota archaeon]|nr:uracil-DNA glycosylase [Candidatus Thermoplasmatota archaeon]
MAMQQEMEAITKSVMTCTRCELYKTRTHAVAGEGTITSPLLFIGEAPGHHEDMQGKPFVGKAGNILDELLASIGLNRHDIYITNILKCRPPQNRNPLKSEISACSIYLEKQLECIQPKILVPLGNFATAYLFEKFGLHFTRISDVCGKLYRVTTLSGTTTIAPLYHPAVVTYDSSKKAQLLKDMEALKSALP